ncbi:nucleoside transporter [Xylaria bambusicola]|uniref:nucleoside transporter n=1 Tax=Xylaria bambusicola TaxID=326684 RepID=UPI00200848DC|nr:nucleoside transporter [Xylaria bambusicola]KAI0520678.1 nucleoside transporter [Xylaria bambusicola]
MEPLNRNFQSTPAEQQRMLPKDDFDAPLLQHYRRRSRANRIEPPFLWVEYGTFALLGMAMLWSWNMFLAASPYFQDRFRSSKWVSENSQSAIIAVSTFTNLSAMIILTNTQSTGNYSSRVYSGLYVNFFIFALLTASTTVFRDVSPSQYLSFILAMAVSSSWASCLMQNGAFALAASFGRPEYIQAIMAGQGVAGVLPAAAQIFSVLVTPSGETISDGAQFLTFDAEISAFIYFLTAVVVFCLVLLAFVLLQREHSRRAGHQAASTAGQPDGETFAHRLIDQINVLKKLYWCSAAIFTCFVIAMFFPVLTPKVLSVTPPSEANPLLTPATFIPLALLFWNLGDLVGRASALSLPFHGPQALLFALSVARVLFLPLYTLCNIHGRGAIIPSDLFYLLLVQFPYGLTNGWLASNCIMTACERVDTDKRELAGGLMVLCLMCGLTVGSLLSFTVAGI